MLGAIVGDIIGSRFEFEGFKSREFELFTEGSRATDDSVMTLAIAKSLVECKDAPVMLEQSVVKNMQLLGRRYPDAGYGGRFDRWLASDDPQPYYSFGNGSAMRVSPVAYVGDSIDEVIELSDAVTLVTHNHPEGVKGAEAIAVCTYLARTGHDKEYIRDYVEECYYDLDFTLDSIREDYIFHVDCMESVPVAIEAFLESSDFEDAIRGAISVGGDADTLGAMAGAIAGAYYGIPSDISVGASVYLDEYLTDILETFERTFM